MDGLSQRIGTEPPSATPDGGYRPAARRGYPDQARKGGAGESAVAVLRRPHSAAAVRSRWPAGRSRADCRRTRRVQVVDPARRPVACRGAAARVPGAGTSRRRSLAGAARARAGRTRLPAVHCPTTAGHRHADARQTSRWPDGRRRSQQGDRIRAATVFRSQRTSVLAALAADWTRGAVKAVPVGLTLTAGFLRCWTIAAGQPAAVGFLLGLDPHAPDTYEPLAAVCAAAGLAGSLLGIRGGGPAVRIVGYRRCARLAEMIGTPPPEAPRGAFPALSH